MVVLVFIFYPQVQPHLVAAHMLGAYIDSLDKIVAGHSVFNIPEQIRAFIAKEGGGVAEGDSPSASVVDHSGII